MKKREWDVVRAKQLYDEGLDDLAIADMVGATEDAIKAWRARNRMKTNAAPVRGKRTAEPAPALAGCQDSGKSLLETAQTVPPEASFAPAAPVTDEPPVPPEDLPISTPPAAPAPTPSASSRMELSLSTGSCEIYITGEAAEVIRLLDSVRTIAVGLLPK